VKYIDYNNCSFVIYGGNADYLKCLYSEEAEFNVILMQGLTPKMGSIYSFLYRMQNSEKINRIVNIPLKFLWYKHLSQKKVLINNEKYFIFFDNNRLAQDDSFHAYLRRTFPEAKLIYMLSGVYNVSHLKSKNYIERLRDEFDLVITFDKEDANKYNWGYCPFPYTKVYVEHSYYPESDVFYVGYAKSESYPERFNCIIDTYSILQAAGLRCDFHIVGVDKKMQKYSNEISYNKPITYQEVLQRVQKTKCILEVIQPDQTGTTLRVQEAALYKRKLLTNNQYIKVEPWYNSKNIKVFNDPEDIDTNWILSPYEYSSINYEDMFSYKRQLKFIVDYFK